MLEINGSEDDLMRATTEYNAVLGLICGIEQGEIEAALYGEAKGVTPLSKIFETECFTREIKAALEVYLKEIRKTIRDILNEDECIEQDMEGTDDGK